jgi:hypothetical protein|tara:strand:+ start:2927 stop:3400 length:474 start_codon:yes stop_codon:yes gene_type:complete
MGSENKKSLSPAMTKARNAILAPFGDYTFEEALNEVDISLKEEKNPKTRLALLSAKSWIIRNKVHALINEPFVYSLNELESCTIFSAEDNDDDHGEKNAIDNLFGDDDDDTGRVEISIVKSKSFQGVKYLKDTVLEVSIDDAERLVAEKIAKYLGDA